MSDFFVLRWEVDRVSELDYKGRESPIEHHFGLPWTLYVRKESTKRTHNIPHFGLYLCCAEENAFNLWNSECTSEVILVHRTIEEENKRKKFTRLFTEEHSGWGDALVIAFSEILKPASGFIRYDKVIVEARTTINSINFIRKRFIYDFTHLFPNADNVVVKLEDGTLNICRKFLAWHSPYFATILSEDCKQNGQTEFQIKNLLTKDFTELLHVIFPSERPVNIDTYETILKLARQFQIERAFNLVENYLILSNTINNCTKLLFAEEYGLETLKSVCFDSLTSLQAIKKLENHPTFSQYPNSLKVSLLNKAFELIK